MSQIQATPKLCRAGMAQVKITPPVGCSLAGYFHDRISESVRDDLHAKAMVVESEGRRIALVSCDLISMARDTSEPAKALISSEVGIPPDHVLICATHTHTGPELRRDGMVPRDEDYVARLPRLIADAVAQAAQSMFTATVRLGREHVEGYSFNRLFRMKDGTEVFGLRGREDVIGQAGPIDPQLQTLTLVDEEGRLRGMAVNFALHPDVIGGGGGRFISADWPGEVGRNIAAVYGDDVVTLFLQGTAGDINHVTHQPTFLPRGGPEKAVQLGRALAGAAMCASERAEPLTDLPLGAELQLIDIPYYTRDDKLMAEIAALKAKAELSDAERARIQRAEAWPHDDKLAQVPVHVLRLGDLALVGLPAEIFVRIGLDIKHWSPAEHTMVIELANARSSTYVPSTDQAERGAYGTQPTLSRWLCADAGRRMADAAVVMLHRLWG